MGEPPYTVQLPGGLQVQEAYKGQYYVPHPGMAGIATYLPFGRSPIICAVVGAIAAGVAGYGAMKVAKQTTTNAATAAAAGAAVGGVLGWLLCGKGNG